jgi:hypothetical protein
MGAGALALFEGVHDQADSNGVFQRAILALTHFWWNWMANWFPFYASSLFGVGSNDRSCLATDVFRFG